MLDATPETIVSDKELRALFWGTVWRMPPQIRCVITHLYICDRSFEEVATLMGISCETLQLLHHRAIAHLRARIQEWH